jgi:hypothetical protein
VRMQTTVIVVTLLMTPFAARCAGLEGILDQRDIALSSARGSCVEKAESCVCVRKLCLER